jgi:hypothetical protein
MELDNTVGNVLIKQKISYYPNVYFYLKEDLSFTTKREKAGRFHITKPGNSNVVNGDRVHINNGNRTLMLSNNETSTHRLKLLDRDQQLAKKVSDTFVLTNNSDNMEAIGYEKPYYILANRKNKTGLHLYWPMELVGQSMQLTAQAFLNIDSFALCEDNPQQLCRFQFYIEDYYRPSFVKASERTQVPDPLATKNVFDQNDKLSLDQPIRLEGKGGVVLLMLLMMLLAMIILVTNQH